MLGQDGYNKKKGEKMEKDPIKEEIDGCRSIIVEVIPDPKTQLKIIANTIIYQYLNKIDTKFIESGSRAIYFVGKSKKYRWKKLFDKEINDSEILKQYNKSMKYIIKNKNIPHQIRVILKCFYVKYPDKKTIKEFLIKINNLKYKKTFELEETLNTTIAFMPNVRNKISFVEFRRTIGYILATVFVPKKKEIDWDKNLSICTWGYISEKSINSNFKIIKLKEAINQIDSGPYINKDTEFNDLFSLGIYSEDKDAFQCRTSIILIDESTLFNELFFYNVKIVALTTKIFTPKNKEVNIEYINMILTTINRNNKRKKYNQSLHQLLDKKIFLPPLKIQNNIIEKIHLLNSEIIEHKCRAFEKAEEIEDIIWHYPI